MHEFQCGHEQCGSRIIAPNRAALMREIERHLKEVHNIDRTTEALLNYLESTCVTTTG